MQGLRSITSHIRQGPPDIKDEMWNHISKATDVQACISGNITGADESLMLNLNGFVKTCNSTNFFTVRVRDGEKSSGGRTIGSGKRGPVPERIQQMCMKMVVKDTERACAEIQPDFRSNETVQAVEDLNVGSNRWVWC
ncbi:hypothetical protein VN97_g8705 [Penicillium thymicola]|uniref:Uncharacterized protein n=1 Tax=Penicillium thymicola TaxID=293382 RepID=A0AAI9X5X8_PENTH|nr:hypothetical protein VN97_g8705 [Penicillium thymicola]